MGLLSIKLLLFLAFINCFRCTDTQVTETDANSTITLPNNVAVEDATETNSSEPELQTQPDLYRLDTTLVSTTIPILEHPTTVNTMPLSTEIEQTSPETISETTYNAQIEQTTMAITAAVTVYAETIATELKTTDVPITSPYAGFNFPEMTSPTEHPTDLIISALTTNSPQQLNPTFKMTDAPEDLTKFQSIMPTQLDRDTTISTDTLTSTSQSSEFASEAPSVFDDSSVSSHFSTVTTGENVNQSVRPIEPNWLLIILLCVIITCGMCVFMILLIQRRKKNASLTFGSMYVNGQNKRSNKKKGVADDAWAGPVNLEAGNECNAEVQDGLLTNDGKQDGDDVVLSTFATLDEDNMSNGGVGGEGTKEATKWEEQEPMLYIDEDIDEGKVKKALANNEGQKGDDKKEEKEMNGETFCLTTAV